MELHYLPLFVAAIAQFILGMIWYGPVFGKSWMKVHGVETCSPEDMKKTQKAMMPFFGLQFVLTVITTAALAMAMTIYAEYSPLVLAFWVWLGFMMPVQVASVIWGNDMRGGFWFKKILIMTSHQLLTVLLAAWVYGFWA